MFSQAHLNDFPSYQDLAKSFKARGYDHPSHDMVCLQMAQSWRLCEGAEPNSLWSGCVLPHFLRYAPYKEADAVKL